MVELTVARDSRARCAAAASASGNSSPMTRPDHPLANGGKEFPRDVGHFLSAIGVMSEIRPGQSGRFGSEFRDVDRADIAGCLAVAHQMPKSPETVEGVVEGVAPDSVIDHPVASPRRARNGTPEKRRWGWG